MYSCTNNYIVGVDPVVGDILDEVEINGEDEEEEEEQEDESEDNRIICIEVEPGLIECFEI